MAIDTTRTAKTDWQHRLQYWCSILYLVQKFKKITKFTVDYSDVRTLPKGIYAHLLPDGKNRVRLQI